MFKILKWVILYIVIQFGLLLLMAIGYVGLGNDVNSFANFLNNYQFVIAILLAVIFIPLLYKEYKKEPIEKNKLAEDSIFSLIGLGIILSLLFNIFGYYLTRFLPITDVFQGGNNILISLITIGIIGPIIEELMFRGIMYRDCKKKYSNMTSILITTFVFTLLHFSFIQMIYAFALGFLLIYVYEKYHSLKAPIILHITSNITTTLFMPLLIKSNFIVNYSIFFICLVILAITFVRFKKSML